ncbi:histidinol-phosphate transaminase [Candidatus Thioglobus sp. NP1]|uniref:histidinol-phosphate transaminase n=1 Tax=Candidatus Thioglobus sp. NP1 TaxID=2508687 RepID=UPI000DED45FE|nr:histidinol-phosphate transaminase [Candidatus Thioglobus sp. NP1]AXE61610.1 histidinol-phosphate transaminase [Candidatus Thioglobus sp. NP1]
MTFIEQWLRTDIRDIKAYNVPSSKNMLKLDAMESPFGIPENLQPDFLDCLKRAQVNRYPDANAEELNTTIRSLMDIPNDLGVLLGNGSDELIQLLAMACNSGDLIMSFEPSFVMYEMISKFTHLNYEGISLNENFEIDLDITVKSITSKKPKLIFIAYPNNPTGNSFDNEVIKEIIKSTDALVVLDEAYYAYSEKSFIDEISNFPNLIVLRTISKIGFAGLRLGILVGSQGTIEQLNKLRLPYNINILTQASANFLLKEKKNIHNNAKTIIDERGRVFKELSLISQLTVFPSQANFILVKADNINSLNEFLKSHGILVKSFKDGSKLKNFLRITISKLQENNTFLNCIKDYYGKS